MSMAHSHYLSLSLERLQVSRAWPMPPDDGDSEEGGRAGGETPKDDGDSDEGGRAGGETPKDDSDGEKGREETPKQWWHYGAQNEDDGSGGKKSQKRKEPAKQAKAKAKEKGMRGYAWVNEDDGEV
ncbi:hypothetical protein B0H14DRAFT_2637680 [Mycena olivaceomarginata]|nr:hypothetical protein B0H14DRAFT_2637680 [Mycena olivaceomarginata]